MSGVLSLQVRSFKEGNYGVQGGDMTVLPDQVIKLLPDQVNGPLLDKVIKPLPDQVIRNCRL